jgi:hypothetical protein
MESISESEHRCAGTTIPSPGHQNNGWRAEVQILGHGCSLDFKLGDLSLISIEGRDLPTGGAS